MRWFVRSTATNLYVESKNRSGSFASKLYDNLVHGGVAFIPIGLLTCWRVYLAALYVYIYIYIYIYTHIDHCTFGIPQHTNLFLPVCVANRLQLLKGDH